MKSFFPGTGGAAHGSGESGEQPPTEALPVTEPNGPALWRRGLEPGSLAVEIAPEAATEHPAESSDTLMLPSADEEPFIPKSRYVMGRSTKILVCVVLTAAGMFAGSAVQRQIDAGTRGSRTNFGNFQGPGGGTGTGSGNPVPGQGHRYGGTAGGGAAGSAGSGAQGGSPAPGTGR